jgi:hypothetical protein
MLDPNASVRLVLLTVLLLLLAPRGPAEAQDSSLQAICKDPLVEAAGARGECLAAAQAAVSGQSGLGMLIAGGNPTPGTAAPAGLGLGLSQRISLGLRIQAIAVELPDIVAEAVADQLDFIDAFDAVAPALSADLSARLFDGFEISPGVAGVGGLSLLGNATYLPFRVFTDELDASNFAYGIGGRLHLLSESFSTPAVSVSLMWRHLPELEFGDICHSGEVSLGATSPQGIQPGGCTGGGDLGEIAFDLTDLSGRAVVSKQLFGLGTAVGMGFDRFGSDIDVGFRGSEILDTGAAPIFRARNREVDSTRWTVFGNLAYTAVVVSLAVEAGWQQGKAPISGFSDIATNFDPRKGTWYGSFGARLTF